MRSSILLPKSEKILEEQTFWERMKDQGRFAWNCVQHPRTISSLFPTSYTALDRIYDKINGEARVVVECGPGIKKGPLRLMQKGRVAPNGKIILIEKTPEFAANLKQLEKQDRRVRVFCDSAENIQEILKKMGETHADYVFSSIPLSLMPREESRRIIVNIRNALADDGAFIVFLFRYRVKGYLQEVFRNIRTEWEWRNIPPLFIFEARKEKDT